ncbi:hypothetical protein dsx2_2217 [Desulfovibrio sp. X2]|nr:hypothetical protein dsx2_2217 [Desulfovibrio sp. X2]
MDATFVNVDSLSKTSRHTLFDTRPHGRTLFLLAASRFESVSGRPHPPSPPHV